MGLLEKIREAKPRALNFIDWCIMVGGGRWKPRPVDFLIGELIEHALRGRLQRLLVSMPPRHGKTTIFVHNLVSYYLSHFPYENVIVTAYSQRLADEYGRSIKDIIEEYGDVSPYNVSIREDVRAKHRFLVDWPGDGGGLLSVGAGGSILGFGASLIVIDDPIRNMDEAMRPRGQEHLRRWYHTTIKTRLEKRKNGLPGIMIVTAQRLHEYDLHGIIMEDEKTISYKDAIKKLDENEPIKDWVDLTIPALSWGRNVDPLGRKHMVPLWPEQRSREWLRRERKAMGEVYFETVYQCRPPKAGSKLLKESWIQYYDGIPGEDYRVYQAWDLAISEGERADYTVCTTVGVTEDNKVYVLDWFKDRIDFPTQVRKLRELYHEYQPELVAVEDVAYQRALPQAVLSEELIPIRRIRPDSDKIRRIISAFTAFENGMVYLPRSHPLLDDFLREYSRFPHGEHDDMLDSMAYALRVANESMKPFFGYVKF